MAVYMRTARKTKLIRCKGNWRDRDEANTAPEFGNKGNRSIRELEGYMPDKDRKTHRQKNSEKAFNKK